MSYGYLRRNGALALPALLAEAAERLHRVHAPVGGGTHKMITLLHSINKGSELDISKDRDKQRHILIINRDEERYEDRKDRRKDGERYRQRLV